MNVLECVSAEMHGSQYAGYATIRKALCHPVEGTDSMHADEQWMDDAETVLKTPIECGEHAYIYGGYTLLGAMSGDKIYLDTGSLKTPARAHAVNCYVLDECDLNIDPDTWLLQHNGMAYDLRNVENVVVVGGAEVIFADGKPHEYDVQAYRAEHEGSKKAIKFYAEFLVNTILDFGGEPAAAFDMIVDERAYLYTPETFFHSGFAQLDKDALWRWIDKMAFIPDVVEAAFAVLDDTAGDRYTERTVQYRPLKGKMVWDLKKNITSLCLSGLGYPVGLERS